MLLPTETLDVGVEAGPLGEGLPAEAREGLLTGVGHHVPLELGLAEEGLVALPARVRVHPCGVGPRLTGTAMQQTVTVIVTVTVRRAGWCAGWTRSARCPARRLLTRLVLH